VLLLLFQLVMELGLRRQWLQQSRTFGQVQRLLHRRLRDQLSVFD
jgi:hypothetical protein